MFGAHKTRGWFDGSREHLENPDEVSSVGISASVSSLFVGRSVKATNPNVRFRPTSSRHLDEEF
jgi:hypothetical protein